MDYLAGGETVDFADIQNDIYYLLDKGSYVVDEIGSGTDNKSNGYDFDFVNDIDRSGPDRGRRSSRQDRID